jgi:hypothetical protein
MTYSEDEHALGGEATVYLCVPDGYAATIATVAPEGVEVEPESLNLTDGSGGGVPTLWAAPPL